MKMVRNGQLDDLNTLQKRHLMIHFYFMARFFLLERADFDQALEFMRHLTPKWWIKNPKLRIHFHDTLEISRRLFGKSNQILDFCSKMTFFIRKWIYFPRYFFTWIFQNGSSWRHFEKYIQILDFCSRDIFWRLGLFSKIVKFMKVISDFGFSDGFSKNEIFAVFSRCFG